MAAEVPRGDEIMACSGAVKPSCVVGKREVLHVPLQKKNQTPNQHLDVSLSVCSPAGLGCISKTTSGGVGLYKTLVVQVVPNKAGVVEPVPCSA